MASPVAPTAADRPRPSPSITLDDPKTNPQSSPHWVKLLHRPDDRFIENAKELSSILLRDIASFKSGDSGCGDASGAEISVLPKVGSIIARWSCVCGYVEALTTRRDDRYAPFPLPIDALCRLAEEEFFAFVREVGLKIGEGERLEHREAVRRMSNAVWSKVISKPSVRDEAHSNSMYVFLRGKIERRTLDCFGSAVVTIAGLLISGYCSHLTLSEDHAYESHPQKTSTCSQSLDSESAIHIKQYGTCEIAVPGNTKSAQSKRGKEIADTFSWNPHKTSRLNPQTSWLYMASFPILCDCVGKSLAALVANINCQISANLSSGALYEIKRELLWVLYDQGCIDDFPFALAELGECEENCSSDRGFKWVHAEVLGGINVLMNERLFLDAIMVARKKYGDSQVYPYCYAGHYHKDAGRESVPQEYRLVEALRLYSHAARVMSRYPFEPSDSMQLVKTSTKLADLIGDDILAIPGDRNGKKSKKRKPRQWQEKNNSIAAATWLLSFYDYLLLWEENSGDMLKGGDQPLSCTGRQFVEILNPGHKNAIDKLFDLFDRDVRQQMVNIVYDQSCATDKTKKQDSAWDAVKQHELSYYHLPKSKRLQNRDSLLVMAILKTKITVGEIELTIPGNENNNRRTRTKRPRLDL